MTLTTWRTRPILPIRRHPEVAYQNEVVLVYSEIDQALHQAVDAKTYGMPSGPTSTINYRPSLFLVNGESYFNDSVATIPAGTASQTTLIRILNAGLRTHAPVLDNGSLKIVAEDGNKFPFSKDQATVMLAAGKTHDALWSPAASGVYSLYDRTLGLNAPGQGSAGMLIKLRVGVVVAVGSDAPAPGGQSGQFLRSPRCTDPGIGARQRRKLRCLGAARYATGSRRVDVFPCRHFHLRPGSIVPGADIHVRSPERDERRQRTGTGHAHRPGSQRARGDRAGGRS